jgi:amino acid adenylation domain-containing protein/non-ribosomal peptide synthase protein (TIGR01720 family)
MKTENIEDLYELSPMQQGMLFHSLAAPESGVYVEYVSCTVQGKLNIPAFKRAWQQVMERHPVWRTSFYWEGFDKPLQVVNQHVSLPWQQFDWRVLPPVEQQEQLEAFLQTERKRGFELSEAPLMRLALIQMGEDIYEFIWSHHHLLLDGWSLSLVLKEVFAFYEAFCQGQDLQLKRSRPYRDYIAWLQEQDLAEAEAFWRQALSGLSAPTPLRVDRALGSLSSEVESYDEQEIQLSVEATASLQSLARGHQLTVSTLVHGAWAILLSRYSGQEDVVFGATVSGRPADLAGVESMVGLFINTLPIRVQASPEAFLLDWLKQLQAQQIELRQYEYSSLVQVQGWSDVPRGLPLFESIVVFENYPVNASLGSPEGRLEFLNVRGVERTNYPLTLVALPGTQLSLQLSYDCRSFDAVTITQMLRHLQTLLEGIVANPGQRLKNLPLLTQQERHTLLVDWNDTEVDYPKHLCIHQLFEAQVERTPDAVAVVFEDEQLTYQELNGRANQLAHHLRSLDVGPDSLVGICVERSLKMIVGFLGILKAGGAYVPLDPSYPQERLAFMLKDAQVSVLLTQQQLVEKLPEHQARVVCLDTDWETLAQHSEENPKSEVMPDHLAYVMYTSGSTGRPKGVSVIHRGVVRLVKETNYASFSTEEVFLQLAPISFDASTFEIWGSLLNSARLVVMPPVTPSLQELGQALEQYQVTTLWLTAGLFHLMVDEQIEGLKGVRQLLAGGDVLSVGHVKKVLQEIKGLTLINGYGPTENTTFTCCYPITEPSLVGNSVPIGRPIANTQVYLLDDYLQPVPVGVPGELYIGGDGLARGYLNRPDLNSERFIPNPFSDKKGDRLYKTGDRARYLSDGNIEFLGRLDNQVKIRGFRIEPGEIEAVLGKHQAVQEVVVVVREDVPDNKRLVAYLVVNQLAAPTIPHLKQFLKQKLPEYMVPSAFVMLSALPLTPNGKIDRRALPAPDTSSSEEEGACVPPQTPVEEMVAGIWADVLAVKQVSIHDNFFDLGGHSLLATQLISRLRDTFCVEFPLRGLFDSPTVAGLSERLEQFLRTELLAVPPLLPVSREGEMLLSFAQARLWFLEQLEPGSSAYNIPAAVRLTGSLHVAVLEQSLNEIVQRHEVLRTTFATVSGEPTQVIAPVLALTVPRVDLRNLPEAQQEAQVERLATEEAQQPFDLAKGPLLRATLLHLGEAEHVLLLTMHHIVSDGWSMGVLIRELAALYEAFSTGKPSPLPELPIQYADFAHWQRQWLQGEVLAAQLSYWEQQLTGAPALLELPTDRPRPAVQTFRGATQFLALPEPLSQKLKTLSQRSGVTLFMTLLAAFQTLLYRYTGQEDICIGSPIANRNRSETEELIGFFVNTLVLRADMSENPTFQELLGRVREVTLGAYAHQDLPFEQLVEALQPERNLSHQPLFQVMFALQNAPMPALELPNLTLSSLEIESGTAKFDLTLSMEDTEQGLVGSLEYNTDLFHGTTISRMLGHFQTLLEGIVAEPDQRLSDLPLLTQPERQQLLVEWNDTQADYSKDVCIHQLFEAQSEQTPEAVAVVFEGQQLTYRELNCRANQVAHHLRSLGVGPEGLVGICVERSLEMVIGLLGILKAGGAYVPLDPDYPKERLAYMLSDSQVPVLLTQEKLMLGLSEHQARVVCLDRDWGVSLAENEENPVSGVKPENLAYVIYTSGSTGKPKGVLVTHQGLCNLSSAQIRLFDLHSDSRVLQFASFSFDASIWEIVMALCSGAMLCLGTRESLLPGSSLMKVLLEYAITHITLPPSALAALPTEELPALQNIIVAGEACSMGLFAQWSKGRRFFNAYGPTESTVCGTVYECPNGSDKLPIGRPIVNTQVYILDPHLQPVPVGVPGELYIGGAGLARGYLNRPELTSEKFICNPFSDEPRARLYKTGDLARYQPDGNIEFLGRLDDQVKIRGFRIELGEIEAVLGQHPAVQETVVVVREDIPGNKRLVAYLVTKESPALSMQELYRFLKQQLPEYMVPSAFVLLDALPLTANGKVDRRVLPAPDTTRPELVGTYVAPRTSVEELLAGIWADVLGLEKVGIHDNFFELGGDSILSIQIVARANQAGLRLTPKQLFGHQTIAELATVAGTTSVFQAEQGLVTGEVPLTPIQQWFFEQEFAEPHHWNQATLLEVPPTLDLVLLQRVVQQLLIHHDALRLRFVRSASGWQQVNAFPDEAFSCTRVDLSSLPKGEQTPAIEATASELQASLNLELGPIVRVALFDLGSNQPNRLLFVIHHLAVDGVSWRILLEDFQTGYQQLSCEGAMKLPPKTTSFQNWAQCLIEYAQSPALEQELDYWLDSSRSAVAPLPVDYSAGKEANTVASACNVSVSLSAEETRALLQEVPKAYHTQINDVLLTSTVQAFAQWTGTRCLLVNLEGHGREEILEAVDLSRTVGWFTTIFPVVLELQADAPGEALKSVKEQLRRIPNRGIGYGLLRYLKKDATIIEKLRALPQAEVSFNYLGQFDRVLSPDGLFELAKESSGSEHSQRSIRSHLLEVNGSIVEGQLQLNWTYSSNLHQQRTIENLAQNFVATLRSLITHCQSPEIGGYTPSDFPEINLNQEKLDEILAEIDLGSMED